MFAFAHEYFPINFLLDLTSALRRTSVLGSIPYLDRLIPFGVLCILLSCTFSFGFYSSPRSLGKPGCFSPIFSKFYSHDIFGT